MFPAITVIIAWLAVGYYLVLLMAATSKIPQEFFDTGQVEGANAWRILFHVTLPMIWDAISIAMVLWMIFALKQFEIPYAFNGTSGVPAEAYTLPIYIVVMGFGMRDPIFKLGYASAIGCVLLFIVVILTVLILRLTRREHVEY